ncbi:Pre-mRNA-splicing factor SLU7 family protein [Onchocerca flexuosa]|uniref:Pre-mRNA-splicing factor SLU7 n=1 Tax=Onchocerca flexuosa TaxID=387005 RepID=A0A238BUN1_9BILA|nr:Pre-mRNA-splicing factor SLU7 family protein [Onchocerca flexuosa]
MAWVKLYCFREKEMASSSSEIPVSKLLRQEIGIGDVQEGRKSKDEYRKQKDLEEEQKLGIAPATVDVITGRDINPHIPEFIAKHPWYVPAGGPTLQHQRPHEERQIKWSSIDDWYKRGTTNERATKFRKGACENCGAMTHRKKECLERPRKVGAMWTNQDIAPDEYVQPNLTLGWDAKRDRWNGYDPQTYKQVVEEHEKLEQTRKLLRGEKMKGELLKEELEAGESNHHIAEEPADEDMYADDADMAGVTVDMDSRTRITVRNLRIREDTAKYLYNLDPNGPYYDPKSRSMRENPFANIPGKEKEAAKFAGENFIRYTGEVVQANEAQVFAWQARCKGIDVHALAEPTKLEAMKKEFEQQKLSAKDEHKSKLLEKYGGEKYLHAPPKELLLAQTENYVEYNRKGKVVKGEERRVVLSRYEEDKYLNNHKSVWGSYWKSGQWGFACCHSFIKNSYCLGEIGKTKNTINVEASVLPQNVSTDLNVKQETTDVSSENELGREENSSAGDESSLETSNSEINSEEEKEREKERLYELEKDDEKKKKKELEQAIKKINKDWEDAEESLQLGDRKRRYHSNYDVNAPTSAEMEAYKLTKIHADDPMADFIKEKCWKKHSKKD